MVVATVSHKATAVLTSPSFLRTDYSVLCTLYAFTYPVLMQSLCFPPFCGRSRGLIPLALLFFPAVYMLSNLKKHLEEVLLGKEEIFCLIKFKIFLKPNFLLIVSKPVFSVASPKGLQMSWKQIFWGEKIGPLKSALLSDWAQGRQTKSTSMTWRANLQLKEE